MSESAFDLDLDEEDRKSFAKVIKEIVDSKVRQKGEADYQREAVKSLAETYMLSPKLINTIIRYRVKMNFIEQKAETEGIIDAYECLWGTETETDQN
ncbi:MAG: hypothetical protein KAS32_23785 [Candidatus Peribacteraceae bacterium]|nr:hypothetical protein [Candidatus Peribacteraceae bacterium]